MVRKYKTKLQVYYCGRILRFEKLILKKEFIKKLILKFFSFGDLDERITLSMLELFDNQRNKKFFVKSHPGSSMIKKL